jgi:K+-sensing histidine kinase KdpD
MQSPPARKFKRLSPFIGRLADAFPGGVAYLDAGLVFTFCNDVQAAYFGRAVEDVVGRHLHEVAPNNPDFWSAIELVARTGERSAQMALSVTWSDRPEEGEHQFVASYIPDLARHDVVRGVFMTTTEVALAISTDTDERVALRERNAMLEQIVKERDLLLGIISHEIRAPLTTIFGNAHLLLRRLEDLDVESRTRAISDIREEAERLNRLVENMLLLARAGGQAPIPTEPVLLERVLADVTSEHHKRFVQREVAVSIKPAGLMAEAQPDYTKQVIQNLLGNAEKYSPADQKIDVRVRCSGLNEMKISILDRGPGVPIAESEIIFQAFYRSDRTSTTVAGAGIGLAVCKLLVQAQSGRIWMQPRRGGGSVFAFTLPAAA